MSCIEIPRMKNAKIFTTEHDRIQNLETTKQTFEISEAENGFRYTNLFDKCIIFVGIFCAVLSGIGQPAIAVISGKITNVLLTQSPESEEFHKSALFFIYLYLCVGIATLIINYIQFICFQSTCFRIVARLQKQYIRAILRQNSAWFDRNKSGELTTRLNENIEHLRKGIGDKLGLLIRGIAMFISSQIIAFFFQWRLALVMFPVAPISCFIMAKLAQRTDAALEKELDDSSKAGVIAEECIIGVRTVQAFNGQQEMVERYRRQLCKGKKYGISRSCWSGMLDGLFFFVLLIFLGIGFLYGGYLLKIGIFKNPGELFTVVFSIVMGSYFLGLVSPHLMVLLNARTAAATIYQIIDRQPKIDASCKDGLSFDVIKGKISFKDIHFRYPSRKNVQVLKQLNLIVEPGQKVALVGQSGCGKSTLIGLLTRMYEQESGIVSIDDMPVNEANIRWLRNVIGVVEQEPVLFTDTVEENLRLGDPNANLEQMIEVCRIANAHDFILKLPQGYKTRIGDGGVQLSGGQKQRVAIARTLIRNSKILLLDEATSALDVKSENAVLEALKNALIGRTVIIIAHRFSSIRNADRIVVIDKGTITEQGLLSLNIILIFFNTILFSDYCSRIGNSSSAIGVDSFVPASDPIFAGSEMSEEDCKSSFGFITIFKNAQGNYILMNSLSGVVSENVILSIRCRALLNILHQDAAYFDNPSHAAGNLITRLASDAPNIKMVLDSRMLQVIFGISAFSICTIIGFIYSWQVTLTGISLSLVLSVLQAYLSRWVYYKNLLLMKEDKAGSLAVEIIEGVRTIQLLTRENVFHSKYSNACSIRLKHELQKTRIEAINFAISQTFQYFMLALSYAVGIHIIVERWKEYHDPAIVAHLLGGIGLMNSTIYFPEFIKARSSAKLLFTVTERKSKLDELEEGEKIDIAGNISFHNVSFSYPRKREYPVMNKIQFNVAKGQTVALIGSSGAGKSTVISLLERFYDPDSGSVRFDGKDLRKLNLYHLRSQMALVGQNAQLFSGSIKENVCFGLKESVSTDRVLEALQLANARTFVESLPMGLETEIGEKGTLLSGGQRQRIAIARAVIRNPKILLLDEATSALDSESENMVQKALDQVRMGCTCITIAHRLSSVQNSDQIICIENGYVQEIGTHESLIAKGGYYCDLIQQQ
ncbi:unnamed protein product [Thelazia callipaeda]|uniref:Transferred entry: 7.6.2.2 n=1 Tax=Thelazia callipaeda TaxID=103827 RepID=A0A0N5D2Q9_THECL|nr:unnamed protein product [Thelazia callipaeda]